MFLDYQPDAYEAVEKLAVADIREAMQIVSKAEREARLSDIKQVTVAELAEAGSPFEGRQKELSAAVTSVTKKVVRERVLREKVRIDGRGLTDIRTLGAEVQVLPRVHGSALFERGETQILGVTTLNKIGRAHV